MIDLRAADIRRIAFDLPIKKDVTYHGRLYQYQDKLGASVSMATACHVPISRQEWLKSTDKDKADEVRDSAATTGTMLHTIPQSEADGTEASVPEDRKEEAKEWAKEWEKARDQHSITAEHSEVMVFSKIFCFGGTIDRIGGFDGKRSIIDFKTGNFNYADLWKTEAYRQAYIEMTGDTEVGMTVLYLPRPDLLKRGQKPRSYTVRHHTSCFLAFLSCYQSFKMQYAKELLKAGMKESDVYSHLAFLLYEREHGTGNNMEAK